MQPSSIANVPNQTLNHPMLNSTRDNLALGRGKRPKLNHETVAMRMAPETKAALEAIAASYRCYYGGKPWIAGFLTKIAQGELIVVPAPPSRSLHQSSANPGDSTDVKPLRKGEERDPRTVVADHIQERCESYSRA